MNRRGFTLIELMIVIAIIAIIAAIAIPGLLAAQRASNERNASASLKTITTAEADFRSNDRDGDRQSNFWVRDIYALFALTPSSNGTANGPGGTNVAAMVKLIEPSVAAADITGIAPVTGCVGTASAISVWSPKASYGYRPFASYQTAAGSTIYGTAGSITGYGTAYNTSKFGFMAMPTSYSAGRQAFIVNEDNTIYRADPGGNYNATYTGGAVASGQMTWVSAVIGGVAFTPTSSFPLSPTGVGWSKLD